jgi:hypothetical protein
LKKLSISDSIDIICDLNKVLDDAYWEANNCEEKDHVYNLVNILNTEFIELSKLSVQDHHFDYEVISISQEALKHALTQFQQRLSTQVRRQSTQIQLNAFLNQLIMALDTH